jgi:hypothetical protein
MNGRKSRSVSDDVYSDMEKENAGRLSKGEKGRELGRTSNSLGSFQSFCKALI